MRGDKEGGDSKEVVSEVVLAVCISIIRTVNHEFRASLCEDELQEVASNSSKPVAVHDGNLRDHPREDVLQKGL